MFDSRERAYRAYRSRGDQLSAARVAVWIAWDSAAFRGEEGVAKGWLQRARRLLEGQPESAEHAFLAARAAVFALLDDGNPEEAETLAAEAIRVGQAIGAIDYEMVGRALHGFALVTMGRVTEGLRELDEVSAAILAGELSDRLLIALAGCYLIGACDRAPRPRARGPVVRPHQGTQPQVGAEAALRGVPDAVRVGLHVARRLGRSRA